MKLARFTNAVQHRALRLTKVGLYKLHLIKEPFTVTVARWFKDRGDETLRINYPLSPTSIVWDLGGYHGNWSADIASRYDPYIFIFEPLPNFFAQLVKRFQFNPKVKIYNCGISDRDGIAEIAELDDASSIYKSIGSRLQIRLRDVSRVISENSIQKVDLIKINIEGEEYPVLHRMLECHIVPLCTDIQVQFHTFYPDAELLRNKIRTELSKTHFLTYDYRFVWENWRKKSL
jgi:FkbM family methyltransferase